MKIHNHHLHMGQSGNPLLEEPLHSTPQQPKSETTTEARDAQLLSQIAQANKASAQATVTDADAATVLSQATSRLIAGSPQAAAAQTNLLRGDVAQLLQP